MGSCISKCNPQKNFQEEDDHHHECVKDKLVISQTPLSSTVSLSSSSSHIELRKSVCPSPSSSSASLSSFSSTATSTTLSSSLSSSSSSASSSYFKDRSFSNDFLLSCAQEHDHILDLKKNKTTNNCASQNMSTMSTSSNKLYSQSSSSPLSKPPSPRRESPSTPKKRPRANSPTMARQKSLRKEHDQQLKGGNNIGNTSNVTSTYHHHFLPSTRTTLKSPSPSRRFPSTQKDDMKESSFRRSVVTKGNSGSIISRSSSLRRENHFKHLPAATPNLEGRMKTNALKVTPKIDEMETGEVKSSKDLDSFLMEDINNPLIALDCFIFL